MPYLGVEGELSDEPTTGYNITTPVSLLLIKVPLTGDDTPYTYTAVTNAYN